MSGFRTARRRWTASCHCRRTSGARYRGSGRPLRRPLAWEPKITGGLPRALAGDGFTYDVLMDGDEVGKGLTARSSLFYLMGLDGGTERPPETATAARLRAFPGSACLAASCWVFKKTRLGASRSCARVPMTRLASEPRLPLSQTPPILVRVRAAEHTPRGRFRVSSVVLLGVS